MEKKTYTLKDGTELAYYEEGTGRPVLFLPGWASCSALSFGHMCLPVIGREYRAVSYDQRGTGDTAPSMTRPVTVDMLVEDIYDVLRGLDLKDCTLVGHSMGGSEIMNYVGRFGCDEYIHSAVLVDISPRVTQDPKDPGWEHAMHRGAHTIENGLKDYEWMKKDFRGWYEDFTCASRPYLRDLPPEEFKATVDEKLSHFKYQEQTDLYISTLYVDVRASLPRFTCPVAYFYADPGSLYTPELADYYRDHIKAPYTPVPFASSTHAFPILMKEEFCERLLEYLKV